MQIGWQPTKQMAGSRRNADKRYIGEVCEVAGLLSRIEEADGEALIRVFLQRLLRFGFCLSRSSVCP
jgi:hypothetical protein